MEPMAKRLCLESLRITDRRFMSLNDDCILKFFEYFDLNELCVIGKTCKRLQQLVEQFLHLRFQNKIMSEVRIQVTFDREIIVLREEPYVSNFLHFMRNVRICEGFIKRPLDMVEFMRNNCNRSLRNIAFEQIKFHKLHGALIIDWLLTVEGLAFYGCQNLDQVLRYCVNLKHLKIDQYSKDRTNGWMEQTYPTIEHLQYDIMLPSRTLLTFLTNNPNVKSLALKLDRSRQTMELMCQIKYINLEELFITFDQLHEIVGFENQLKAICNRDNFKRLELCFQYGNRWRRVNFLKDLKHLSGLHVLRNDEPLPSNLTLEHLKVLQLTYVSKLSTDIISKNLPNLEELYLMFLAENFQDLVAPFARNAVKLNKIVARDFKIPNRTEMTNARLAKYFNDEREKLVDACRLIIYIGTDEYDQSLDSTAAKFRLVQIRRVSFLCKEFDYVKPYLCSFEF